MNPEDIVRDWIISQTPQLHNDAQAIADLLRESVKFEREKAGLDNPKGTLELHPNKDKKSPAQPDLIGSGWVAGRRYGAAAWISATDKLKIALLPERRK